ncbi:MAG: hypothetical protein ACI80V_003337 [Rhodothermales bacterium]|jgi:hypothetical protein
MVLYDLLVLLHGNPLGRNPAFTDSDEFVLVSLSHGLKGELFVWTMGLVAALAHYHGLPVFHGRAARHPAPFDFGQEPGIGLKVCDAPVLKRADGLEQRSGVRPIRRHAVEGLDTLGVPLFRVSVDALQKPLEINTVGERDERPRKQPGKARCPFPPDR